MKYTVFGSTGLNVSRIALGGYPFGGVNNANGWNPFTPDGRGTAISTINRALDLGINYIDTAPSYGDGNSESIIGEVMRTRRGDCALATKVGWHGLTAQEVIQSAEASLKRLQTDCVDVIQFHGGSFEPAHIDEILRLADALDRLREQGKARLIGFTVEEPWTARPLIEAGRFQVMQVRYNLIYQSAALHALNDATRQGMGITVMRPMTSGILQRLAGYLAPEWDQAHSLFDACLKFVLSDSRVHMANVGMRWPHEVEANVKLVDDFEPAFDVAELPRLTAGIYQAQDRDMDMPTGEA
jgi:aryl-alcohol dehydrogenase-like predicted oxidoreductase